MKCRILFVNTKTFRVQTVQRKAKADPTNAIAATTHDSVPRLPADDEVVLAGAIVTEATVGLLLLLLTVGMDTEEVKVAVDRTEERDDSAEDAAEDIPEAPEEAALDRLLAAELAADEMLAGLPVDIGTATGASTKDSVTVVPPICSSQSAVPPPKLPLGLHAIAAVTEAWGISKVSATSADPSMSVTV